MIQSENYQTNLWCAARMLRPSAVDTKPSFLTETIRQTKTEAAKAAVEMLNLPSTKSLYANGISILPVQVRISFP